MHDGGRRRIWWWVIPIVALTGLIVFFLVSRTGQETRKMVVPERARSVAKVQIPAKEQIQEVQQPPGEKEPSVPQSEETAAVVIKKPIPPAHMPEETGPEDVEVDIREFFRYLDQKDYVRKLSPKKDTYTRFKEILQRLSTRPPIPAGEGVDPGIITANIYHLFRSLTREDLRLIKAVLRNEADAMEMNLRIMNRWLTNNNASPDVENLKPSLDVRYHYAGFFMNTIGGRAYLFRRAAGLRLLVMYYSLVTLHDAEKRGKNYYGIDLFPLIPSLTEEISRYPDFQYQQEYIARLRTIEADYQGRR
jgi:hypothetical protein